MIGFNEMVTLGACAVFGLLVWKGPRSARHTSLITAWRWLIFSGFALCAMAISDFLAHLWPERTSDYGWFFVAIVLLCPPMAVLGSRRPGVQYWTPFILLPLIVVLAWPVWTLLLQGAEPRGLELETPTVVGFCLVLAMGAGNYLGTRFASSALVFAASLLILLLTCTGGVLSTSVSTPSVRASSLFGLVVAAVFAMIPPRTKSIRHPVNQLWDDFRQLYGIVWGLRIVERINAYAAQQQWSIRISWSGFPETATHQLAANETEVQQACRWLFRRFVDEEWVAERLETNSEPLDSR